MIFGWTTSDTSDKFAVEGLEPDEQVIEVFHKTIDTEGSAEDTPSLQDTKGMEEK
jgi:hypothetical protein